MVGWLTFPTAQYVESLRTKPQPHYTAPTTRDALALALCEAITSNLLSPQELLKFAVDTQSQLRVELSPRIRYVSPHPPKAARIVIKWKETRQGEQAHIEAAAQLKEPSEMVAKLEDEKK
jgi:hypothetical protein